MEWKRDPQHRALVWGEEGLYAKKMLERHQPDGLNWTQEIEVFEEAHKIIFNEVK